jgi:hypothetical protein
MNAHRLPYDFSDRVNAGRFWAVSLDLPDDDSIADVNVLPGIFESCEPPPSRIFEVGS